MGSSKRDQDFQKGKKLRTKAARNLNNALPDGFKVARIHKQLRTMHVADKVKNLKLSNLIIPAAFTKAMGLDYYLQKTDIHVLTIRHTIPLRFLFYDGSGNIFLKLPKYFKDHPDDYLALLAKLEYHFIVADPDRMVFSLPIPILTFINNWNPRMELSKGNKNRLNFHGPVSKIQLSPAQATDAWGASTIRNLIDLLK